MEWLSRLLGRSHTGCRGTLQAIYVAERAGEPMREMPSAEITMEGLDGDRYARGDGFWKATDGCQVTLIAEEDLSRAQRRSGIPLAHGEHRRNLVVGGLAIASMEHRQLRIGAAVLTWLRPRPPCGYLDSITRPGTAKALGRRSGICLRVVSGGTIRVGDAVEIIHTPDRRRG